MATTWAVLLPSRGTVASCVLAARLVNLTVTASK